MIHLKDINYNSVESIQAAGPYSVVRFVNGKTFAASRSLKYMLEYWPDMVRISRSHAINPNHVKQVEGNEITTKTGAKYVSSGKWRKFVV